MGHSVENFVITMDEKCFHIIVVTNVSNIAMPHWFHSVSGIPFYC